MSADGCGQLHQLYCGHFCCIAPPQLWFCSDTGVTSWALTVPLGYFSEERSDYGFVIYIRKCLQRGSAVGGRSAKVGCIARTLYKPQGTQSHAYLPPCVQGTILCQCDHFVNRFSHCLGLDLHRQQARYIASAMCRCDASRKSSMKEAHAE